MIIFENLKWKNFLSTGNQFTEVNLAQDRSTIIVGANGAGKSTILDALTFALFGKPFRKINKPQLLNSINMGDCVVNLNFNIGRNKYEVTRGIKPAVFEVKQNGVALNQDASVVDQQKNFEQTILKMNYKSFTQIVVLGSSTFVPFMRLPLAARRDIIEDILDIQIFSSMNVNLKDKIRNINDELKDHEYKLSLVKEKIDMQKQFMIDIEKKNKEDIQEKESRKEQFLTEALGYETEILNNDKEIDEKSSAISDTQKIKKRLLKSKHSRIKSQLNKTHTQKRNHSLKKMILAPHAVKVSKSISNMRRSRFSRINLLRWRKQCLIWDNNFPTSKLKRIPLFF